MPTIDLSQLPKPTIIEELDFETITVDVKALMVAVFPADQQSAVAAALGLESELLKHHRLCDGVPRATVTSAHQRGGGGLHAQSFDWRRSGQYYGQPDTERLTITSATDTTDAVTESDEALRLRAQAAFEDERRRAIGGI